MLEGRLVVYEGDDAVEERGGVVGGGRVCRVVDGSVMVCEQSVVIHRGYEGVAVRIWGRGDKQGMLLRRLVSPGTYHGRAWAGTQAAVYVNCASFNGNRIPAPGSETASPPCIKGPSSRLAQGSLIDSSIPRSTILIARHDCLISSL